MPGVIRRLWRLDPPTCTSRQAPMGLQSFHRNHVNLPPFTPLGDPGCRPLGFPLHNCVTGSKGSSIPGAEHEPAYCRPCVTAAIATVLLSTVGWAERSDPQRELTARVGVTGRFCGSPFEPSATRMFAPASCLRSRNLTSIYLWILPVESSRTSPARALRAAAESLCANWPL
jgi:hypothetical protein